MHDESPGGIACKDRALAFWTDQSRFNAYGKRKDWRKQHVRNTRAQRFALGFAAGTIVAAIIGG